MKTALITGASGGLGLCLARVFLKQGYRVITLSRRGTSVEGAESFRVDLGNPEEIDGFISGRNVVLDRLDVLINNAAISPAARILNTAEEDFDLALQVNFTAARKLIQGFYPKLAGEGAIINVLSRVGMEGRIGLCAYAASKGLLAGYTRDLAIRSRGDGIRAYGVNPGFMVTGMVQEKTIEAQKRESLLGTVSIPEHSAEMIYWISREALGPGPFFDLDSRVYHRWMR